MSTPTSPADIKFPLPATLDEEIRKLLEEEGIVFKEDRIESSYVDPEIDIEAGIFSMNNSGARYGEFCDLEELLIEKGIPFDRRSYMDWNRPPVLRVFRPGDPPFNRVFELDSEGYEPVGSLPEIRKILDHATSSIDAVTRLNAHFAEKLPAYPPLTDFVRAK